MMNFDPYSLIRQLLPTFQRKPLRIARLEAWLTPFIRRWNSYGLWRSAIYYEAQVTAQIISIEACLNRRFDPDRRRITVGDDYFDNRVYVSLYDEQYELYIDGHDGTLVHLDNEQLLDGFAVNLPADLAGVAEQVRGAVDNIKALGVKHQINISN
jgi:hypothetical protein